MIILNGKFAKAKIFTDDIENEAINQIIALLNNPVSENATVRFMPDVHAGAGAVIGTTITFTDKVIPNMVGVDIGCGVLSVKLDTEFVDFEKLDNYIKSEIPSGRNVRENINIELERDFVEIAKMTEQDVDYVAASLGTLGGGNHFIEIDANEKAFYLTVHTGSRNFGLKIANFFQRKAKEICRKKYSLEIVNKLKAEGREKEISEVLAENKIPSGQEFLSGDDAQDYLEAMKVAQRYAKLNRRLIVEKIANGMGWRVEEEIESVHNYIDFDDKIVRKGAISAHEDQIVVIPLNMRDGIIIGRGLGNADWNYSAPHGAGRRMSRRAAKENIDIESFKNSMKDIYSTTVNFDTIDEAPMAYKPSEDIINYVKETVEIIDIIKPIYNFKASE